MDIAWSDMSTRGVYIDQIPNVDSRISNCCCIRENTNAGYNTTPGHYSAEAGTTFIGCLNVTALCGYHEGELTGSLAAVSVVTYNRNIGTHYQIVL